MNRILQFLGLKKETSEAIKHMALGAFWTLIFISIISTVFLVMATIDFVPGCPK